MKKELTKGKRRGKNFTLQSLLFSNPNHQKRLHPIKTEFKLNWKIIYYIIECNLNANSFFHFFKKDRTWSKTVSLMCFYTIIISFYGTLNLIPKDVLFCAVYSCFVSVYSLSPSLVSLCLLAITWLNVKLCNFLLDVYDIRQKKSISC